jgi:hypothetical protein
LEQLFLKHIQTPFKGPLGPVYRAGTGQAYRAANISDIFPDGKPENTDSEETVSMTEGAAPGSRQSMASRLEIVPIRDFP